VPKSDFELIEEFQRGKAEGFNELVRRYQQKVYWIARRIMSTHDDADDVVQDVFIRVYKSLGKFRGDSEFYTWLYRITMNVSLNALRVKRVKDFVHYEDFMDSRSDPADRPDSGLLHQEYKTILERAIDRLPPKQRMVFVMRYYDEIPYEEMAAMLGKSVGGLKANYFHALKKIQNYVRREMGR
jgi:RNA polymerase sigma-70 factor (ECF subfamily)